MIKIYFYNMVSVFSVFVVWIVVYDIMVGYITYNGSSCKYSHLGAL